LAGVQSKSKSSNAEARRTQRNAEKRLGWVRAGLVGCALAHRIATVKRHAEAYPGGRAQRREAIVSALRVTRLSQHASGFRLTGQISSNARHSTVLRFPFARLGALCASALQLLIGLGSLDESRADELLRRSFQCAARNKSSASDDLSRAAH